MADGVDDSGQWFIDAVNHMREQMSVLQYRAEITEHRMKKLEERIQYSEAVIKVLASYLTKVEAWQRMN
jgi:hypothetical protein